MTEPIITVADELTEASKYAEVIDPRNSVESSEFLTGEELIRVLHPVFDEQIINYGAYKFGVLRRAVRFTVILIWRCISLLISSISLWVIRMRLMR